MSASGFRGWVLGVAVLASSEGRAAPDADADPLRVSEGLGAPRPKAPGTLGLALHAGVPAGVSLGLAWRPLPWGRVELGAAHNLAGFGVEGSLTFAPLEGVLTPLFALEVGHFFDGDLRRFARTVLGVREDGLPRRLSYTFANAHLGVELRHGDFAVFLRGGYGLLTARASSSSGDAGDGIRFEEPTHALVLGPSGRLGLVVYLL